MSGPSPEQQAARYSLLCRALQASPAPDDPLAPVQEQLDQLDALIHHDLLALARQASPDDFADLYLDFTRELRRFREFAAYPALAGKTVVAFGGAFSAGKSSLVNALIGQPLMVVEVDPTTALPAYVLAGPHDAIHALNAQGLRVALTDDEFASLTHDEKTLYGSEVARALSAAFVVRREFPWGNLAFIDTPGYSGQRSGGGRTDASVSAAQLNSAHAIVWVVNLKQGVLPESDIAFLARLDPAIPKLIVASRADQLNDSDRAAVMQRIADTLAERNLPVLGVWPASAHPRHRDLLTPIRAQLAQWDAHVQPQAFARRFKALFVRYQRGLERERKRSQWERNRLNRLLLLAEGDMHGMVQELCDANDTQRQRLDDVGQELAALRGRFFLELKRVGDAVGIPLPEPQEMELLELGRSNLLDVLIALRQEQGRPEPDMHQVLQPLRQKTREPQHRALLLRRVPRNAQPLLREPGTPARQAQLLRRDRQPIAPALAALRA